MSFYSLAAYLQPDSVQPISISADKNAALVIAISISLVALILLCAMVYVTTQKRALHQLFEDFTNQQENWIENRVTQRMKGFESSSPEIPRLSRALIKSNKSDNEQLNLVTISLSSLIRDLKKEIVPELVEKQIYVSTDIPEGINLQVSPGALKKNLKNLVTIATNNNLETSSLQISSTVKPEEVILKIITHKVTQETQSEHQETNSSATLTHDKHADPQISTPYLFYCQLVLSSTGRELNTPVSSLSNMPYHLNLTADIDGSTPQFDPLMQHVRIT